MNRFLPVIAWGCVAAALTACARSSSAAEEPPRAVLVRAERLDDGLLARSKARGANLIVVLVDDATTPLRLGVVGRAAARAEIAWAAWIEVGRCPSLADEHPEWMASPGNHHDDWRRLFPNLPKPSEHQAIKLWPWVPIGYEPAYEAQRQRVLELARRLPPSCSGLFLNDLQAGPSSCGCGNDQCRWALDYGTKPTAPKVASVDDVASRFVASIQTAFPDRLIVPVWTTECEDVDLPNAPDGTGLCGGVPCSKGDCWRRYVAAWNPLAKTVRGPIAVAAWSETFHRDPKTWPDAALALFQHPPRNATPLDDTRAFLAIEAWDKPEDAAFKLFEHYRTSSAGVLLALDKVDQSWTPKLIKATSNGELKASAGH